MELLDRPTDSQGSLGPVEIWIDIMLNYISTGPTIVLQRSFADFAAYDEAKIPIEYLIVQLAI